MYLLQLLLVALLTSDSARAAVSVPSEYNSSYTSMTVTTERYACSGELTGTRVSTQVGSIAWELEKLWGTFWDHNKYLLSIDSYISWQAREVGNFDPPPPPPAAHVLKAQQVGLTQVLGTLVFLRVLQKWLLGGPGWLNNILYSMVL